MRNRFSVIHICPPYNKLLLVKLLVFSCATFAQEQDDLFLMSIEELLNVEVETRKTKERFSDVPLSNTIYTQTFLDTHHIDTIYELAEYSPNLSYRPSFGKIQERGVIRGVSNVIGENVTGFFIDGMAINGLINSIDLSDYKYVDVIRGPQAALYGRNTFAGAVNLVSHNPLEQVFSQVEVAISDQKKINVTAKHGTQFSPNFAMQSHIRFNNKPGHYPNELGDGGGSLGDERNVLATTKLALNHRDIQSSLNLGYSHDDDGVYPVALQPASNNNCYLDSMRQYFCGAVRPPTPFGINLLALEPLPFSGYQSTSMWLIGGIERQLSERHHAQVKFAVTTNDQRYTVDGDYSDVPFYWIEVDNEMNTVESELIVSSNWSDTFSTVTGLVVFNKDLDSKIGRLLLSGDDVVEGATQNDKSSVDNKAFYLSSSWHISVNSDLIMDLRWSEDRIAFANPTRSGQQTYQSLTPKLTYRYQHETLGMMYASVVNGTKPGGFNANIWDDALDTIGDQNKREQYRTYRQESLWQWEIGIKGTTSDNSLTYTASLYHGLWDHLQTTQSVSLQHIDNSIQAVSVISNEGQANIAGMEFDLNKPFSEQFQAWLNFGYAYTELVNSATAAHLQLTGNGDVSGNHIPNAPELTAAGGVTYQLQIRDWQVQLVSSIHHESERFVAEHNLATIPAINKLKLGVNGSLADWNLSLHTSIAEHSSHVESAARFGDPASFFRLRAFALSLSDKNYTEFTVSYDF